MIHQEGSITFERERTKEKRERRDKTNKSHFLLNTQTSFIVDYEKDSYYINRVRFTILVFLCTQDYNEIIITYTYDIYDFTILLNFTILANRKKHKK